MPDKQTEFEPKPLGDHPIFGSIESIIFGGNVEHLRILQGMNRSVFSKVAGISRPTLYKIERGEADIKLSLMKRVADALDVSVVELLTPRTK